MKFRHFLTSLAPFWMISLISMGFLPAFHFLPAGAIERSFRFRHKR